MMPTFAVTQATLLTTLTAMGWKVSPALKIPHATSPDGSIRLWFKPQAIHYTKVSHWGTLHEFKNARAVWQLGVDLRKVEPAILIRAAMRQIG